MHRLRQQQLVARILPHRIRERTLLQHRVAEPKAQRFEPRAESRRPGADDCNVDGLLDAVGARHATRKEPTNMLDGDLPLVDRVLHQAAATKLAHDEEPGNVRLEVGIQQRHVHAVHRRAGVHRDGADGAGGDALPVTYA